MAQVELGASKSDAQAAVCCMLDPEMQPGAEDGSASTQKAAANQSLALSAGTELQASAIIRPPHSATSSSTLMRDTAPSIMCLTWAFTACSTWACQCVCTPAVVPLKEVSLR